MLYLYMYMNREREREREKQKKKERSDFKMFIPLLVIANLLMLTACRTN